MKTKLFSLFLMPIISIGTLFASDTSVDGIWYNFDSNTLTAEVTYQGTLYYEYSDEYSGSITIPASITYNKKTYKVTSIGKYAFSGCAALTSVTIGNSVVSVGNYAFSGCTSLTSITIPNSVTSIGEGAFKSCASLFSVNIPNSVKSIGYYAFNNVPNIIYSGMATGSPWGAKSKNGFVDGCFVYSNNTKTNLLACFGTVQGEISIPNSVTSIGNSALSLCANLTYVTIPNSVKSIGEYAFEDCKSLSSVTIPNSITSIADYTFLRCAGLTSITIPNSVKSIGNFAFKGCTGLTSITIPNSVTSIGVATFFGCTDLTSLTIPNSVTSIGESTLSGCTSLTSINVVADNPNYCSIDGVLFNKDKTTLIQYPGGKNGAYIIPNSVTSIGDMAFLDCRSLTSITCEALYPPTLGMFVFDGVDNSIPLYVLAGSVNAYKAADQWKEFNYILPIEAKETEVTTPIVEPNATSAEIAWPIISGAATYELVIKDKNGNVICTLIFNKNGQLTSISFNAQGRNATQQAQTAGFSFTVTSLEAGTSYDVFITAKDNNGNTLQTNSLSFQTESLTTIHNVVTGDVQSTKFLRNGQID